MRTKLEFNFKDEEEFNTFVRDLERGRKALSVLWDFDQKLRGVVKYTENETTSTDVEEADKIRGQLWELLQAEGLDLYDE